MRSPSADGPQPGSATAALAGILLEHPVAIGRKREVPQSGMYKIRNQLRCGRGEDGQTTVEYALILAALSIAAIVAVVYMSGALRDTFGRATPSPDAQSTRTQAFRPPVTCDAHYIGACIRHRLPTWTAMTSLSWELRAR